MPKTLREDLSPIQGGPLKVENIEDIPLLKSTTQTECNICWCEHPVSDGSFITIDEEISGVREWNQTSGDSVDLIVRAKNRTILRYPLFHQDYTQFAKLCGTLPKS